MQTDHAHLDLPYRSSQIEHKYPKNIHILSNPYGNSLLTKLCQETTVLPEVNSLVKSLYQILMAEVFNTTLDRVTEAVETRMIEITEKGKLETQILNPANKLISVDLARAGTWPSHVCFEMITQILNPAYSRQDHIYINRKTNDKGEVIGENFYGSKIGGDQDGAYVIFPDPMGATGGSLSRCVNHYKETVEGKAKKYIALHLIITPEYVQRITKDHPDVEVFAMRLDRGNSADNILKTIPGTHLDQESGLTDIQYIVPGAGGMGEVLNNSYV